MPVNGLKESEALYEAGEARVSWSRGSVHEAGGVTGIAARVRLSVLASRLCRSCCFRTQSRQNDGGVYEVCRNFLILPRGLSPREVYR